MEDENLSIEDLRAKNDARLERLEKQGRPLMRNEGEYFKLLLESLCEPDQVAKIKLEFERKFAEDLDKQEKDLRRRQILATNGR